jgi:hypothetical protein
LNPAGTRYGLFMVLALLAIALFAAAFASALDFLLVVAVLVALMWLTGVFAGSIGRGGARRW